MEKKIIKTWGVTLVLFLAVFSASLITIFRPVEYVTESMDGSITTYASLFATSKTWIKNPDYFAMVGIIGLTGLAGAGWCSYMINKAGKEE